MIMRKAGKDRERKRKRDGKKERRLGESKRIVIMEGEMWEMKKETEKKGRIPYLSYPSFRILVRVLRCPTTIK